MDRVSNMADYISDKDIPDRELVSNRQFIVISIYFLSIIIASILSSTDAVGDTLLFQPWITVEQEYTDNILFSANNPKNDYITTISPAFSVKKKTYKFDGDITSAIDANFYKDEDELNDVDKRVSASLSYLFTERLKMGVSGGYIEDSQVDREVTDTGLIFLGDREKMHAALSGQYQLSEITGLDMSARYISEDINFPENENSFPDKEENSSFITNLSISRNISKWINNTTALFDISFMRYTSESPDTQFVAYSELPDDIILVIEKPEDATSLPKLFKNYYSKSDYDIWNMSAGFAKELTERLSFFLKSGVSCVNSEETSETSRLSISSSDIPFYDAESALDGETKWGWILFGGVNYKGLYDRIEANISRDVQTASSLNGTTERSGIAIKYTRNITEKLSSRLSTSSYLNQNDRVSLPDIDELTLNGNVGLTYKLSKLWKGYLDWDYTKSEDRERDIDRDRNRVYARIVRTFEI